MKNTNAAHVVTIIDVMKNYINDYLEGHNKGILCASFTGFNRCMTMLPCTAKMQYRIRLLYKLAYTAFELCRAQCVTFCTNEHETK